MDIKEVPYGSELYESSKVLREKVLRHPLGMVLREEDVAGEDEQTHIGAFDENGRLLGAGILKPLSSDVVKLRQMAVDQDAQGMGTGRRIVQYAETVARARGFKVIEMHARYYAKGFYEKLGYRETGAVFKEVGMPHIKMFKIL